MLLMMRLKPGLSSILTEKMREERGKREGRESVGGREERERIEGEYGA